MCLFLSSVNFRMQSANRLSDFFPPERLPCYCARPVHRHSGWKGTDGFAGGAVGVQTGESRAQRGNNLMSLRGNTFYKTHLGLFPLAYKDISLTQSL